MDWIFLHYVPCEIWVLPLYIYIYISYILVCLLPFCQKRMFVTLESKCYGEASCKWKLERSFACLSYLSVWFIFGIYSVSTNAVVSIISFPKTLTYHQFILQKQVNLSINKGWVIGLVRWCWIWTLKYVHIKVSGLTLRMLSIFFTGCKKSWWTSIWYWF